MGTNLQFSVNSFTFAKEAFNGKTYFCSRIKTLNIITVNFFSRENIHHLVTCEKLKVTSLRRKYLMPKLISRDQGNIREETPVKKTLE